MSKARDLSAFVSTPADAGSSVKLKEGSDNGSNFIELKSPASLAADVTFVLPSADGTNGQALTTNGSGALAWSTVGGTPGGSDTQIQYNSSGSFAGASGLVTDGSNLTINAQGDLRFADSDSSNWVAFQAPATIASNVTWTLPDADGTSGQVLSTNGTGTLSWATASGGGGGGGTSVTVTQATATASQTTFSVTYTVGQLSVYLNGALLASADYTATNGTTVVLASGAASGDIFTAVAYSTVTTVSQGDTAIEVTDTGSDGTITFDTDGSEAMRIDASQNVGIGITSPAERLHVSGAGRFSRTTQPTQYIEAEASGGISYINVANGTSGVYQSLVFNSSNNASTVERMRINGTGALVLGGGNTSATGTGIAFPATQSASTDANTLDDYEEGTWTPVFKDSSQNTISLNPANASTYKYTKIGNVVTLTYHYAQQTSNINNIRLITGLPFTPQAGAGFWISSFPYGSYIQSSAGFEAQANLGNWITFAANQTMASSTNWVFSVTYITS